MKPERRDCERYDDLLEAFVDCELEPDARAAVAAHAAGCRRCADQIRLAERIRSGIRELPALDAPARVVAAVKAEARGNVVRGPWRRPLWAALAAAALLAALALGLLAPRAPETAPSEAELVTATEEARYALERVAQLTRKASRGARSELAPRMLARPAVDGLTRSLERVREAAAATRDDEGGAQL